MDDDQTINESVEHILSKIGDEPDEAAGAPEKEQKDTAAKPEAAVAQTQPSGEEEETADPELADEQAIEAPALWNEGIKSRWSELPKDLQSLLAQQEKDRNSGVDKKLNEAAVTRQAADQERQRFAQLADMAVQALSADPVFAEVQKIKDWAAFATENPGAAYSLEKQVEARVNQIRQIQQAQVEQGQKQFQTALEAGEKVLEQKIPEWRDEGKRTELKKAMVGEATERGWSHRELDGLTDPRFILALKDLAEFRTMKAAQKSVVEKKVVAQPTKVIRPGQGQSKSAPDARFKALKATALRSGKESDGLAAVLAAIGE